MSKGPKKGIKGEEGQKEAEKGLKGLKGNLNKSIPFGPLYSPLVRFTPLWSPSPKKATPFNHC